MTLLCAETSNPRQGGPQFSLSHRLFRAIWGGTWLLFAAWTPPPLHGWRRMVLRAFGAEIDKTARIYGSVKIWYPPHLTMKQHAVLAPGVICYCMDRIEIGAYAVVSQRSHLCGGTHDPDDPHFQLLPKPVILKDHAWVAAEAFVGPGVTIGQGAVLGARALTTKDLKPWTIYAGSPARALRQRNNFSPPYPSSSLRA